MKTSRRKFIGHLTSGITTTALAFNGSHLFSMPKMLVQNVSTGKLPHDLYPKLPTIPYGAVYFRKTNPPAKDWERDYKQASDDGINSFRHWFMWSAIEIAPGVYDWEDYDRQLDLASNHGISTIIGIILDLAPQWAFEKYPEARVGVVENSKAQKRLKIDPGDKAHSFYTGASAVSGWPGLCFDNEKVRDHGEAFLEALVKRYRDHPGMAGYDVWNELNHNGDFGACHCEASAKEFRKWLRNRYGSLEKLNKSWYSYSFSDWEELQIPMTIAPYPDSIDWALFRIDNAMRLFDRRVEIIKKFDTKNPVTTHAIPLGALEDVGPETYPLFQVGSKIDIYGYTGGSNHEETSRLRWKHWAKMDLTRSAANGKPFWAAEMPGGTSWNMSGAALDKGRTVNPSDIHLYSLTHFAGGARGIYSPRWRPLQDGIHAGSFAFYAMDGSSTDRSAAAGEMANWANNEDNIHLWEANPVKGDIGILVVPESQIHNYVSEGNADFYFKSITGAYQGFLFNNIQVDFVDINTLETDLQVLYLPYPTMLHESTVRKLKDWVNMGGILISEACPAYFGDRGKVGTSQPNYGLSEVFGAEEAYVQFTPDLLEDLSFNTQSGLMVKGGVNKQTYRPTSGKVMGKYEDGAVAMIENQYGKGRALLIGSCPGYGYTKSYNQENKKFFSYLLQWANHTQHITSSDERIIARLQTGKCKYFLWIINSTREDVPTSFTLSSKWNFLKNCKKITGVEAVFQAGHKIEAVIPKRSGSVLELFT